MCYLKEMAGSREKEYINMCDQSSALKRERLTRLNLPGSYCSCPHKGTRINTSHDVVYF
jgi:hypothetical protein